MKRLLSILDKFYFMRRNIIFSLACFSAIVFFNSCKKDEVAKAEIPETIAHFTNQTSGSFFVQNTPNAIYKIPIGLTTPSGTETKVTVSVSSPTGATAGTQYRLQSTTITIPAGQTIDSLPVQGLFAGYPGNRKDTLV